MEWKKTLFWGARLGIIPVMFILIFAQFPAAVERYYSKGVYPYFGKYFRLLTAWCPFSIGDLLYGAAILFAIFIFVKILYVGFRLKRWPSLK
ncbi:MAG: DUF3810 domain-containing protein, partial [Sediminibacterium sp.]|nr:DUF3810 domain-containing protein [Sediminibacterium sp.]